ncbi:MAG: RNA 2',3'-cyclic phosphodiesterase [Planctomycetota bacterium]|nr:RNA 2',3'-cyclic phosphodiesterase [Planctomycetota bacterium]
MRTFVALRVGPPLRRRLHREAERLKDAENALRLVHEADLHVTLQFLGGTTDDETWRVSRALAEVAEAHPPIHAEYVGLGAFPNAERARVAWAGVREEPETAGRLEALVEAINQALGGLGFPPERRRFHPHVTLGRLRRRPSPAFVAAIEAAAAEPWGAETLSEVKLIVSDPSHQPYHYIDLTTVDLMGGEEDA